MTIDIVKVLQDATDAALAGVDAEISALKSQIADLEHQAEILVAAADKAGAERDAANADLLEAQQTVTAQIAAIGKLNTEIAALEARIAELQAGNPTPTPEPEPEPDPEPEPEPGPIGRTEDASIPADKHYARIKKYPGFPNNRNTGCPKNIVLKPYTGPNPITKDGTVLDGVSYKGTLTIRAKNVVIKNSVVTFTGYYGIDSNTDNFLTVQDTTVIGPGSNGEPNACIIGRGLFERNDLYGAENGLILKGSSSTVRANYIHDLFGKKDGHVDGVPCQGGQDGVLIELNTIASWYTSDIFMKPDWPIVRNIKVDKNLLLMQEAGRYEFGFAINIAKNGNEAPTNITITNNIIEEGYGGWITHPGVTVTKSGNTDYATGKPVS